MCGISGMVSTQEVAKKLFVSLKNLEYRGYDSCGIATILDGKLEIRKDVGTVDEVNEKADLTNWHSNIGIAHTRWATHGGVNKLNAHPHISGTEYDISIVHNGIISNYKELRERLIQRGFVFQSETDSEVIAHLLQYYIDMTTKLEDAIMFAIKDMEGTYAFVGISTKYPDRIFCARQESPLVLGIGGDTMYVASDIHAFIEYTKNCLIMKDGEFAIITSNSYTLKKSDSGKTVKRKITHINWDVEVSKKGGFPHYMLKEIHEQPQSVGTALSVPQEQIQKLAKMIENAQKTYIIGVGTTYYVSFIAQYYFTYLTGRFIPAISSDEFEHLAEINDKTLILAASQSGETYDTLNALRFAKSYNATTSAIINVIGSTMSREVDFAIMQGSGSEICVLSTKAALSQIVILIRIALELAYNIKKISEEEYKKYTLELKQLPVLIQNILDTQSGFIHHIAYKHYNIHNWLFLGRGIYHAIGLEGALKLKEVTYLHAEGMPAGFMKHGTISLIDENMNSLVFVPPTNEKKLFDAMMSNVEEIKARNGLVVGFHFGPSNPLFNDEIILPPTPSLICPLLELVTAQLFAYFTAVALGVNVDKPRSLAKSVTVP